MAFAKVREFVDPEWRPYDAPAYKGIPRYCTFRAGAYYAAYSTKFGAACIKRKRKALVAGAWAPYIKPPPCAVRAIWV
eukprot:6185342-Pleurochrysis_carterae.AAC.1